MTLIELRTESGVKFKKLRKQSDAIGKWIEECEFIKH